MNGDGGYTLAIIDFTVSRADNTGKLYSQPAQKVALGTGRYVIQ
jgi:hypothetical protein